MPGHTNAALASYAELNCDGVAPPLYTGTGVGFSSLCIDKEITYDVRGRRGPRARRHDARPVPAPRRRRGARTPHEDYVRVRRPRAAASSRSHGKRMLGWHEIARRAVSPGTVAQYWDTAPDRGRAQRRARATQVVHVAGQQGLPRHEVRREHAARPVLGGLHRGAGRLRVGPGHVRLGRAGAARSSASEAPLWTETLEDIDDIEFMAFPRMAGIAEIGWSPADGRSWQEYRPRLAQQGRGGTMSVNYYRSPEVAWP